MQINKEYAETLWGRAALLLARPLGQGCSDSCSQGWGTTGMQQNLVTKERKVMF